MSHAMSMLSRYLAKPNIRLVDEAKRVIRYLLKTKDLGITWNVGSEDKKAGFANIKRVLQICLAPRMPRLQCVR